MSPDFDVVELPPCSPPAIGDRVPTFERPLVAADHWRDATLEAVLADGPCVLLFHPMLGSFPATYIWSAVTDRDWIERFDVSVVGVTISTPYDARRFLDDRAPAGRLFSDPANGVADAWDLTHDLDGMAGISAPRPAAFVLEPDRTVRYAWSATQWPAFPDYDAIEAAIGDGG